MPERAARAELPPGATSGVPSIPTPDVSVVITCYNYARYLPQAVATVLGQEGVDLELIIVDDVSTDDSLAVARHLAAKDPRVSVVARKVNGGPVGAFNDGLARVRGRAWVRLDADDLLTPGALRRGLDVIDAHPTIGMVYGRPLFFADADELPPANLEVSRWSLWHGQDWLRGRCAAGTSVISSVEVMVRTAATDEVGGMAPLRHTHDFELWNRVAARWEVAHLDRVHQGYHRVHDASITRTEVNQTVDVRDRAEGFDTLFSSGVLHTEERARLERDARAAVARQALTLSLHRWNRGNDDDDALRDAMRFAAAEYPPIRATRDFAAAQRRLAAGTRTLPMRAGTLMLALRRAVRQNARFAALRRYGVDDLASLRRRRVVRPTPTQAPAAATGT